MTRRQYCQLIIEQIYNGPPPADATVTVNKVNLLLNGAIATAIKMNYVEAFKLDGVKYVNDSFYLTFKDLAVIKDASQNFIYQVSLPAIPVGIGTNDAISGIRLTKDGQTSLAVIMLNNQEWARKEGMRKIGNGILGHYENKTIELESTVLLFNHKARVTMVSGGATDLSTEVNIPDDYMKSVLAFIKEELVFEKTRPMDTANDGKDRP